MDILVILVLGLVALVKSDIGYQYKVPTSYDVPFGSVGGLNDRKYYHVEQRVGSLLPSSHLQTPIHEHSSFNGVNNVPLFTGPSQTSELLNGLHQKQNRPSTFNLLGSTQNTANVGIESKSNFDAHNSQQVEVQKHLYFYSAPDEPEEIKTRIIAPPAPTKKNVKILFIKTPTFNTAPVSIPVLPQNEEKTLVYVLVKKPEETSIVIPTAPPTKPAKPEVYFIKYKTQKEAEEAISNIHDTGSTTFGSGDENVNFISKTSESERTGISGTPIVGSVISGTPTVSTLVSGAPTIVSTPQPTYAPSFGGLSNAQVGIDINGADEVHNFDTRFKSIHGDVSAHTPKVSVLGEGYPKFSSDAVTNFEGSVGAVNLPTASTKISEEVKVHQVYGPPKNQR